MPRYAVETLGRGKRFGLLPLGGGRVYFHSKAGLVDGLCGYLSDRGGMGEMPEVFRLSDPVRALEAYFHQFGRFWASDRTAMRRLRAVAVLDPDAARAMTIRDEQRKGGTRELVERVFAAYPALDVTDKEAAIRTVSLLTSFESFDGLANRKEDLREATRLLFALALGAIGLPAVTRTEETENLPAPRD